MRVAIITTLAGLVLALGGCPNGPGETPPEVLSWRHQIFSTERYQELAGQWAAYAQAHPGDPHAFVEWGDALRYAGETEEANQKYRQAYGLDSTNAHAINAYVQMQCTQFAHLADWELCHQRLLRAAMLAPENPETYYNLWLTSLRTRRLEQAAASLRQIVELGDVSRPLYDYAHNMLTGAPRGAILFTNGDNDTYPPLAYQILEGFRPDVTIVNLSLLNTAWYIRHLREMGLPIELTDAEIERLRATKDNSISAQMQRHLYEQLAAAGWPRDLCYAVTVYDPAKVLPGPRLLEGLHERILAGEEAAAVAQELDIAPDAVPIHAQLNLARTRELLDRAFELDSMTDPQVDWEREMAVAKLGTNYGVLLAKVGEALYMQEPPGAGGPYLERAVAFFDFHDAADWRTGVLERWVELDPGNARLEELRGATGFSRDPASSD